MSHRIQPIELFNPIKPKEMAKLTLKVKKIAFKHPVTKQPGFVARVLTNGTESFDDICEIAGMNTTYAQEEIVACAGLMLKAAARQLKNGKIIDLGPLGKLYPSVSGKWVEKEEDLALTDLSAHANYRPSAESARPSRVHRLAGLPPRMKPTTTLRSLRIPTPLTTRVATTVARLESWKVNGKPLHMTCPISKTH